MNTYEIVMIGFGLYCCLMLTVIAAKLYALYEAATTCPDCGGKDGAHVHQTLTDLAMDDN